MSVQTQEHERTCAICAKTKQILEFGLMKIGIRSWICIECLKTKRAVAQAERERKARRSEWGDVLTEEGQLKKKLGERLVSADRRRDSSIDLLYLLSLYRKQNGKCAITGRDMLIDDVPGPKRRDTVSIDRIDSKRGYEVGNIQLVTSQANMAKSNYTTEELFAFCLDVVKFNKLTT
jgi:CRISPR/Cas system Type II protein with McrA/HNH and RuvC-like nuclease domain